MPDGLLSILLIILVVAIVWLVLKFVLKLTMKIFSCGCLLILVIGGLLFITGYLQIGPSF